MYIAAPGGLKFNQKEMFPGLNLNHNHYRMAEENHLGETFGSKKGAMSLFALANAKGAKVEVIIDKALVDSPANGFHPMTNEATTAISGKDIVKFLDS